MWQLAKPYTLSHVHFKPPVGGRHISDALAAASPNGTCSALQPMIMGFKEQFVATMFPAIPRRPAATAAAAAATTEGMDVDNSVGGDGGYGNNDPDDVAAANVKSRALSLQTVYLYYR